LRADGCWKGSRQSLQMSKSDPSAIPTRGLKFSALDTLAPA